MTGTPGAEPVERDAVELGPLAVQDGRRVPALARVAQLVLGLVVSRDQDGRGLDCAEDADRVAEPVVDGGEVPCSDDDVVVGDALDERARPRRGRRGGR